MFYVHVHMSKIITYDRNAGIVLGGRKMIFIVDAALFVTILRVGVSCNSPSISWGVFNTERAQAPKKTTSIQAWFHRNLDDTPNRIFKLPNGHC